MVSESFTLLTKAFLQYASANCLSQPHCSGSIKTCSIKSQRQVTQRRRASDETRQYRLIVSYFVQDGLLQTAATTRAAVATFNRKLIMSERR